jgi:hypothetical protein
MSRSRRRTPIVGHTKAESEKKDKQRANRRIRRVTRVKLRSNPEQDLLPHVRELSDPWMMSKDGKQWLARPDDPRDLRK